MVKERVQKPIWQPSIQKKQSRIVPPIDNQTEADSLPSAKVQPSRLPSKTERDAIRRSLFEKWADGVSQQESEVVPDEVASAAKGKSGIDIQAKLTIGESGDKYEQEADKVADLVVNQINASVPPQLLQSQSEREAIPEQDKLQMKSEVDIIQREEMLEEEVLHLKPMVQLQLGGMAATSELETSIQQARGRGQPLSENIRQPMEQAFGADFSEVKVHTDTQSDQLNQSIQARAFTTGQDIFFRQREYNPGSKGGQELIAHELTHVVQQNGAMVQQSSNIIQRQIKVREEIYSKNSQVEQIWNGVSTDPDFSKLNSNERNEVKKILETWVTAPANSNIPFRASENRKYDRFEDLAKALVGEVQSLEMKKAETNSAKKVWEDEEIKKKLNNLMKKLKVAFNIEDKPGRYAYHYSSATEIFLGRMRSLKQAVNSWSESTGIEQTISIILDVALDVRPQVKELIQEKSQTEDQTKKKEYESNFYQVLSDKQNEARGTHWNPNEAAQWTKDARTKGSPLSAGPSATTGQALKMVRAINATPEEMRAVAEAAFAFWNLKAFRHKSGIHTLEEVTTVLSFHEEQSALERKYHKEQ